MDNQTHNQTQNNLTEEDWQIVEARLQYDIDNNIGMDMVFGFLKSDEQDGNTKRKGS